jgi:Ca2+-binding EF-hand superfamily protein
MGNKSSSNADFDSPKFQEKVTSLIQNPAKEKEAKKLFQTYDKDKSGQLAKV